MHSNTVENVEIPAWYVDLGKLFPDLMHKIMISYNSLGDRGPVINPE
jgi:hypothetical protein